MSHLVDDHLTQCTGSLAPAGLAHLAMSQNALQIPRRITNSNYPLRSITSNPELCFQCSRRARHVQIRHFSSSRPRNAVLGEMRRAPTNTKQPSMKARMALMDKKDIGNDLGRLPGTIILPQTWSGYPDGLNMKARVLWKKFKDSVIGLSSSVSSCSVYLLG